MCIKNFMQVMYGIHYTKLDSYMDLVHMQSVF